MKISFLHQFNMKTGWGGSASMLKALCTSLLELGHRADVFSPTQPMAGGATTHRLQTDLVLTFGPEKRPGETMIDELDVLAIARLANETADEVERVAFNEGPPQLLVANHISIMALACWHLHRRLGIPYRIISYGTDTQLLLRDGRYRDLFGAAARDADRIMTISGFVASEVRATVGGRIETLGGGVDSRHFFMGPPPARRDRLVYVGRLVTEKGVWILLDAIERQTVAKELIIIGEGPLNDEVANHVARNLLQCRVELKGYVPQVKLRKMLIGCSAAVVPSTWQEPLGLVVLEALACGLPVIASSVGGIPEMIEHGRTGLLIKEGDPVVLADAIEALLGNEALYFSMRRNIERMRVPDFRNLAQRMVTLP
jgi:glycosyltransferase involved in cell wall biosynthesis